MAEVSTKMGERIKALRLQRKESDPRWTQDYAARQVRDDLTGTQFARWERGEVMPREETVELIAEVFGIPPEELYAGEPVEVTEEIASQDQLDRIEGMLQAVIIHLGIDLRGEPGDVSSARKLLAAASEAADQADRLPAQDKKQQRGSATKKRQAAS